MKPTTHDEYIASIPEPARQRLLDIQACVGALHADATRCISYGMPAFRSRRVYFYFAAFKKHIGIYPPVTQDTALIAELAPWRGPKGNLSFPLDQPLPLDLIGRVAVALRGQYDAREKA